MSGISILSAFLLLAGEFFSCCRINEALAKNVVGLFDSIGLSSTARASVPSPAHSTLPSVTYSEPTLGKHAQCHGHGPKKENQAHQTLTPEDQNYSFAYSEFT